MRADAAGFRERHFRIAWGRTAMREPAAHDRGALFELYPPRARGGLDPRRPGAFAEQLARFRRAFLARPQPRAAFLPILDFARLKEHLGRRWPELRAKVLANVEACVARRLEPAEHYLLVDETTIWLLPLAHDRSEVKRRSELIAADITERLLGVTPGARFVRLRLLPFDFASGLRNVAGLLSLRERVETARREAASCEVKLFESHADSLLALWRPVLAVRLARVVGFRAFVRMVMPDGSLALPSRVCPECVTGAFQAQLDCWLLDQAIAVLRMPRPPDAALPVLAIPVHGTTLATPGFRGPWRERLFALPSELSRYIFLEIRDPEVDLSPSQLTAMLAPLEGRVGLVLVRVPPDPAAIRAFKQTAARVASIDASELAAAAPPTPARLAQLVAACAEAGLRSLLVPVSDRALLEQARAAGIDYVAGDACLPPVRVPGQPVRPVLG